MRLLVDRPSGLYGSEFVDLSEGKLKRGSIYTTLDRTPYRTAWKNLLAIRARGREGIARSVFCVYEDGQIMILMR